MSESTSTVSETTSQPRRLLWVVLLLGLALVLLGVVFAWQFWLYHNRQQALKQAASGNFEEAEPNLLRVLERSPDDVEVLAALVHGYLSTNNTSSVRPLLDRWCALSPEDPEPYRLRLKLLRSQDPAAALADGLHLLERSPQDVKLRLRVAGLYFSAGQFKQAEKECRACLAREPGLPSAVRLLGEVLLALDRPEEAAKLLDDWLRQNPDDTAAAMTRAVLYLQGGEPDRAIPLLEKVLRIDPRRQRPARYQLAIAYERAGRKKDAVRVLEELRGLQEAEVLGDALRSQPNNPELQLRAARAFLKRGKIPAALALLGRVLEHQPHHREAHTLLATYYEQAGHPHRAAFHRRAAQSRE